MSQVTFPLLPNAIKPNNDSWMVQNANRPPLIVNEPYRFKKNENEKAETLTAKNSYKAAVKVKNPELVKLQNDMLKEILNSKDTVKINLTLKVVNYN